MNLNAYLKSEGAMSVSELRRVSGIKSDAQIRQWQHGYADRQPSPESCVAIERATDGKVTRRDLRPDDWHRIWPELVTEEFPAPALPEPAATAQP
jgi:DNA-binding transcriptional regulator YdaS (Cro superfamily)